MRLWFEAMWHITTQKYGANDLGLQRVLSLGSYNTVWKWLYRLRRAMVRPCREMLSGTVEVDETYIGGEGSGLGRDVSDSKGNPILAQYNIYWHIGVDASTCFKTSCGSGGRKENKASDKRTPPSSS